MVDFLIVFYTNTMKNFPPKIVILAVYKTDQGDWRGFCAPYDVTCNAPSKEKAMKSIEKMVALYEEGLKQYNYPKHLSVKKLSNRKDQKVFNVIIKDISQKISRKMKEEFLKYQLEQTKEQFNIRFGSGLFSGYYSQQPTCMA